MKVKQKVIIRRCEEYDPKKISGIVKEGMEELGVKPTGKILLKPNVIIAHPEIFPHAFTRKEFLDGMISATKAQAEGIKELSIGERSGITLATRWLFKNAGYPEVIKKHKIKVYYFDEVKQVPVELTREGRLRDLIFVPKPIKECDFLINLPKFKAHPWCRLTLSLKNFIGVQDDRHRLVDHNIFLEHKIADLQEVIQPRFIAIDAIIAGQKMMLTPNPFPMGAIVMGTNSCAVDTVCCHMVHVDPKDLTHLRFAAERGFGPMILDEIEVSGDFPLEEVQEKTKNFEFCLERIDKYFGEDSNLSCTVGTFPEEHSPDYCWGGCPGALQEAIHIFRGFNPNVEKEMKKIRYVVGKVEGPLDLAEDERVIFVGDCTSWEGSIDGQEIKIESSYKATQEVDTRKTKSNDMLLKNLSTLWNCFKNRKSRYIHAKGCTVSVAEVVHYLANMGKIGNPNFDHRIVIPANVGYWQMRFNRFMNRFFG
ncbi:MAG: DUF362 domain-containing protein [Deltaproteobacteria bacterium]|nr:MAG: DUF362 domain-containing protein [Deltaproteobacteria bacterium]